MNKKKVIIIGALGMDFHVFNTVFRDNDEYEVIAFTVAGEQNVGTTEETERKYPSELVVSYTQMESLWFLKTF